MKSSSLIKKSFNCLNEKDKQLYSLLTSLDVKKEDVIDFLNNYDIDNQKAATSFLINKFLDKFDFNEEDNPIIPRIKGLKDFFKFHNLKVLTSLDKKDPIVDADLYLKLSTKNDVRGYSSLDSFIDKGKFVWFTGKSYSSKVLESCKKNKEGYLLPDEKYLTDLLYLKLFFAVVYKHNSQNVLCYLLDIFNQSNHLEISNSLCKTFDRKLFRNKLGGIKRWLVGSTK